MKWRPDGVRNPWYDTYLRFLKPSNKVDYQGFLTPSPANVSHNASEVGSVHL